MKLSDLKRDRKMPANALFEVGAATLYLCAMVQMISTVGSAPAALK